MIWGGNVSNMDEIWVFIGLAGFIFVSSCLFFAVLSYIQTYTLNPEMKKGYPTIWEIENQD